MKSRAHDEAMAELYRKDPEFARQVINDILEDENGDQGELLIVLRQMTKAFGGVQAVAEQAHLNPTQLYRTLSPEGNPALSSFSAILKAMGMRLSVQPLHAPMAQV
jgi:probable addiction module antidote protein